MLSVGAWKRGKEDCLAGRFTNKDEFYDFAVDDGFIVGFHGVEAGFAHGAGVGKGTEDGGGDFTRVKGVYDVAVFAVDDVIGEVAGIT